MNSQKLTFIIATSLFLLLLRTSFVTPSYAQDTNQPTVVPPIVMSSSSLGDVQPQSIEEIMRDTNIAMWRDAGFTGLGQKIGILDLGFGGITDVLSLNNTSVNVAWDEDINIYNQHPIRHGTQVLEVITTIAPGAEITVCSYTDLSSFIRCVDWMRLDNINIINHSAGVPVLPLNGRSRWSQQVNAAYDSGILWVNSAGNFASGAITNAFTDIDNNALHEFRGLPSLESEALGIEGTDTGGTGSIILSWRDRNNVPANEIDLDLQIISVPDGNLIAYSGNEQNGLPQQIPLELIVADLSRDFAIQIIDINGTAVGTEFKLFVEFASLPENDALSQGDCIKIS